MKKKLLIGAALILSVGMACTSGAGDWQSYSGDKRIEERVDSVLALMTLEEKIGQMTQYCFNFLTTRCDHHFFCRHPQDTRDGTSGIPVEDSSALCFRCDTRF